MNKMNNNKKDIVCGAAVCAVSAFLFLYGRATIKVNAFISTGSTNAKSVPSAVFGFMFVLGLMLIGQAIIRDKKSFENKKEYKWMTRDVLVHLGFIAAATIVYVLLAKPIGYFTMTAIYLMFMFLFNKVKPVTAIIITVAACVALYLVFVVLLNVSISMGSMLI